MGCLNSDGHFQHWFGNIHLSGPCNRACYFCIGQFMQSQDPYNVLNTWPLPGLAVFVQTVQEKQIQEIYITGTNTDPLLYTPLLTLLRWLHQTLPSCTIGLRTNGVRWKDCQEAIDLCDGEISLSIHSFDPTRYRQMMGWGEPPSLADILLRFPTKLWKLNIVLSPILLEDHDLFRTLAIASALHIPRINLREPYGQPHVGNPLMEWMEEGRRFGMPYYRMGETEIMYWDVHWVEVESVNLYADGHLSTTYPITQGCVIGDRGDVKEQAQWGMAHARKFPQWKSGK